MKYHLAVVMFAAVAFSFPETTVYQTNWGGDSGVPGPVSSWACDYLEDTLLTAGSSGDLSLTTSFDALRHSVSGGSWECVIPVDVDGDGDMDLAASDLGSSVKWWENREGDGLSWTGHTIANETGITWVDCGDMDGDGDVDFVTAFFDIQSNAFNWWENADGVGTEWVKHTIGGEDMTQPNSVQAADVDGDGDLDVMGSSNYGAGIELFMNDDGAGSSWSRQHLDANNSANNIHAVDFDGDGDIDAVAAQWEEIRWYSNNGSGSSWTANFVHSLGGVDLETVASADLDNDGDLDIVYAACAAKLGWYENNNGSGTAWTGHFLPNCHSTGAMAAAVGDMDGNGTLDIVAGFDWANTVEWWSNSGTGNQWTHRIIDDMDIPYSFCLADLNGDGLVEPAGGGSGGLRWWSPVWEPLSGILTSSILQTNALLEWGEIMWEADIRTGNSVSFQVRSSADPSDMGAWSDTLMLPCSLSTILQANEGFVQYRTIFQRIDDTTIPVLNSISMTYLDASIGVPNSEFHLFGPKHNPTVDMASVSFQIPVDGEVEVIVYDIAGREVSTILEGSVEAGIHWASIWYLESGVYFARVESGPWSDTCSFVVIDQ